MPFLDFGTYDCTFAVSACYRALQAVVLLPMSYLHPLLIHDDGQWLVVVLETWHQRCESQYPTVFHSRQYQFRCVDDNTLTNRGRKITLRQSTQSPNRVLMSSSMFLVCVFVRHTVSSLRLGLTLTKWHHSMIIDVTKYRRELDWSSIRITPALSLRHSCNGRLAGTHMKSTHLKAVLTVVITRRTFMEKWSTYLNTCITLICWTPPSASRSSTNPMKSRILQSLQSTPTKKMKSCYQGWWSNLCSLQHSTRKILLGTSEGRDMR